MAHTGSEFQVGLASGAGRWPARLLSFKVGLQVVRAGGRHGFSVPRWAWKWCGQARLVSHCFPYLKRRRSFSMVSIKPRCRNSGPVTLAMFVTARASTEFQASSSSCAVSRKQWLRSCADTGWRGKAIIFHDKVFMIPPSHLVVGTPFSLLIIFAAPLRTINRIVFLF